MLKESKMAVYSQPSGSLEKRDLQSGVLTTEEKKAASVTPVKTADSLQPMSE